MMKKGISLGACPVRVMGRLGIRKWLSGGGARPLLNDFLNQKVVQDPRNHELTLLKLRPISSNGGL